MINSADGSKETLLSGEVVNNNGKFAAEFIRPQSKTILRILGTLFLTNYRLIWIGADVRFFFLFFIIFYLLFFFNSIFLFLFILFIDFYLKKLLLLLLI